MTLDAFLATVPLFDRLTPEQRSLIQSYIEVQDIPKDRVLLWEGSQHDAMYVLWEGRVMVSKKIRGHSEIVIAHLDPPNYFGEVDLLDGQGSSATVTAEVPCRVLAISQERLRQLLDRDAPLFASFAWALGRSLAGRLRATNQKVQEVVLWGLDATGADPADGG